MESFSSAERQHFERRRDFPSVSDPERSVLGLPIGGRLPFAGQRAGSSSADAKPYTGKTGACPSARSPVHHSHATPHSRAPPPQPYGGSDGPFDISHLAHWREPLVVVHGRDGRRTLAARRPTERSDATDQRPDRERRAEGQTWPAHVPVRHLRRRGILGRHAETARSDRGNAFRRRRPWRQPTHGPGRRPA